ncbi:MAG TPA: G1 family glutamic endopeptidase, partial [Candidatus Paceibacterota bacterium]|nr:G1 family glutamic endopeptidase [Candidatus Paceibacterota bacterium]
GIGGVLSQDLIQAGTEALPDTDGGISYEAWYELLPGGSHTIPVSVHPGDVVSVSVSQQSSADNTWLIVFTNKTTGESNRTNVHYVSSLSSADWIEEMPAGVNMRIGLDNFGAVTFTNGSTVENGVTETIMGSGAQSLTMANNEDVALAIPSTINADGESFSVTRTNAATDSIGEDTLGFAGGDDGGFSWHHHYATPNDSTDSNGTSTTISLPGGFSITLSFGSDGKLYVEASS